MAELEIEVKCSPLTEVPQQHRLEAERRAKQSFVLALLEMGDIKAQQAAELLDMNLPELVKLANTHHISTIEIDAMVLGIEPEELAYINRQAERFDEMRSELLSKYYGKWVLFEDGQVLDIDEDRAALVNRTYEKMGNKQVFIEKVLLEDPQPIVRNAFLDRSAYLG